MLSRADTLGARPATAVEAPLPVAASADARQEIYHRLAQIPLGRQLTAEVLKQLGDGAFLVRIANTQARMVLPNGTQVGDSLPMIMLAAQPRPTFLLAGEAGSASTLLSPAGRLIAALLEAAERRNSPVSISGKGPLLAAAGLLGTAQGAPQLAAALKDALAFSGLFYESHLHEWIAGDRAASELAREPQAQFPRPPVAGETFSRDALAQWLAHSRQPAEDGRSLSALMRDAQRLAASPDSTDADTLVAAPGPKAALAAMSAESAEAIHRQLHVLENRQAVWHGELWPGHRIEWEVTEEDRRRERPDAEPGAWRSMVRFRLPSLGEIDATVHLAGERVRIEVRTPSAQTASLLLSHGDALAEALGAAGSPLETFQVKHDEKP